MLSVGILNKLNYLALLIKQPIHQRLTFSGLLILGKNLINFLTYTVDRDKTVSRRFKPSSRITLVGEQPNPYNLFQLEDVMSRHRGAKRSCR